MRNRQSLHLQQPPPRSMKIPDTGTMAKPPSIDQVLILKLKDPSLNTLHTVTSLIQQQWPPRGIVVNDKMAEGLRLWFVEQSPLFLSTHASRVQQHAVQLLKLILMF